MPDYPNTTVRHFVIPATCHDDDFACAVSFDAVDYFADPNTEDYEITDLREIGYGGDYASDWVAEYFDNDNPQITAMFVYARQRGIGFECHVDGEALENWITAHRPQIALQET